MFIFNRSFLALTRVILFGLICLAIVLWFLNIIPTINSDNGVVGYSVVSENEPEIDDKSEPDFSYENINNDTMVFACVILRHGNTSSSVPGKPLRIEGVQQAYKAGQFCRRRYNKLLGDHGYANNKIYFLSTNTDRAIMSAEAHLAGMFPPTDENRWNDKIWWHPIPLHTLPEEMDIFFRGGKPCPKYHERYDFYMEESPRAKWLWQRYRNDIRYWEIQSGKTFFTIEDVANFHRKLISRKAKSQLESWEKEVIEPGRPMEFIRNIVTKLRSTPELVRRRAGFLIKEILQRCAKKIDGTLHPDRVLYLYSAHSSTILPILNSFEIYEWELPPYSSSLHFEVYKNDQDDYYLQFFYRKPDDEHPLPLNISRCGEKCTLEKFYSEHGELIPGDFESECKL